MASTDTTTPADDQTAEIERLHALLHQASELLRDARSGITDPGLARQWGQQRRRFRDAVIDIEFAVEEAKEQARRASRDHLGEPPFAVVVTGWDIEPGTVVLGPFITEEQASDAGEFTSAYSAIITPVRDLPPDTALVDPNIYWPGRFTTGTPASD